MRVLNAEEIAVLLHDTWIDEKDYLAMIGQPKPSWYELGEHEKDDYRYQARRILEVAKVGRLKD